jgi:quercetin dioxygenase-like cupin family protein
MKKNNDIRNRTDSKKTTEYPRIVLVRDLHDSLETRTKSGLTTLYIDGISIISYSQIKRTHLGRRITFKKDDLEGELYLSNDFFTFSNVGKKKKTDSEMENIAKTFFKVNKDNYVSLVQYLHNKGRSSEHYHSFDESIVQLAGTSQITLRKVEDDSHYKRKTLYPGDILKIPGNTIHQLNIPRDSKKGSITVPIKQTDPDKSDHFKKEKSYNRIKQEVLSLESDSLFDETPYNKHSGPLKGLLFYSDSLTEKEKRILGRVIREVGV